MTGLKYSRAVLSFAVLFSAAFAGGVSAETAGINFDSGAVDVAGIVKNAKAAAKEDSKTDLKEVRIQSRTDRDCVRFTFDPEGPETSEAVWLRSTEYRQECHWVGDPRNGGHRQCREVPRWTYRERVQVELRDRKELYPWERESVAVCLDGRWLSIHEVDLGHHYTSQRTGGRYTLTAGAKKPMDPDRGGISASAPVASGQNLSVTFNDRWASYYSAERVVLKFKLKRVIEGWFDPTLVEKEVSLTVADSYRINFSDYAEEFSEKLKAGKKYYVEWGFKRIGPISNDTYMKRGDGPEGVYRPQLLTVLR
jgi:hypothetical protein